jgi:LacI family transcriptional regulator
MGVPPGDAAAPARAVGIRDVARHAGVSVGTVSNVLNKPGQVSPATRERVSAAIEALGFVPSRAAGSLRRRSSDLVGVVVPDVGNPFWGDVLRGVEHVLDPRGLALVVGSTRQDAGRERRLLRALDEQRVDGLLVAPVAASARTLDRFRDRRLGVVVLDRALRPEPGAATLASVTLDDVHGAELAAGHLADLGHRRVVLVNGPHEISWCADRYEGARRCLAGRGADLVEILVPDLTVEAGRAAVPGVLATPGATAVMCANDLVALGVLRGLRDAGSAVPADWSLTGYDDVDFAAVLSPPLTSVRQPSFAMGAAAATLLVTDPAKREAGERFEPQLVVRASTSPPRG